MRRVVWTMGVVGCAALTGCSSGDDGGPEPFPPAARSFDALVDESVAIFDLREDLPFTDPSTLPESGRATYTGVMGVLVDSDDFIAGDSLAADMRMTADFGTDSVSATATNFVSDRDERLTGEVAFVDGSLDRDVDPNGGGWTFGAEAEGALVAPDGETWEVTDGYMLGDFDGTSPDYAGGAIGLDFVSAATGEYDATIGGFDLVRD